LSSYDDVRIGDTLYLDNGDGTYITFNQDGTSSIYTGSEVNELSIDFLTKS